MVPFQNVRLYRRTMLDASLLVVQGTDQGNRFPLDVPQLLLGRGSRCDVRISDSEVSREHARLELQENRWHFIDLGSSNGSFINGKTVRSQILEQGDQIQVGRTILLYHSGEEPDQSFVQQRIRLVADPSQEESRIVGTATGNAASRIVQDATASSGRLQPAGAVQDYRGRREPHDLA